MVELPPLVIYIIISLGAAVENVIPPIPADTFVLLGAFIAASGRASLLVVFLCTWLANVTSAVAVYLMAHRFGRGFFSTRVGHWLLQPKQLEQIGGFYQKWGIPAIFMSRFLPAFRAMVPVFAGVTHVPLIRVLPPLAFASALWYGALVMLGGAAVRNWAAIMRFFDRASNILFVIAAVFIAAFLAWWWRTRHRPG